MQRARKLTGLKSAKVNPWVDGILKNIVAGKDLVRLRKSAKLFSQGEKADAIYFVRNGKVQITVISPQGKIAVLHTLGPRDFLGEGCLVDDSIRTGTATALEPSLVFRIAKDVMLKALHAQPKISEQFMASLLARNVNLEEDLCDQLFNHTERRLARVLLNLSRFSRHHKLPDTRVPKFTHKLLAEIVGTTRPRIAFFLIKFRKLGLIDYDGTGDITVKDGLLTDIVLRD
jgi:CRP/FNR family transcriptional regulator, cyclic AMP receptor protein